MFNKKSRARILYLPIRPINPLKICVSIFWNIILTGCLSNVTLSEIRDFSLYIVYFLVWVSTGLFYWPHFFHNPYCQSGYRVVVRCDYINFSYWNDVRKLKIRLGNNVFSCHRRIRAAGSVCLSVSFSRKLILFIYVFCPLLSTLR